MAVDTLYYVLAAGLTANTFRFSLTAGGSAINTTGSQSGTHTTISNPLHFQPHPAPKLTVRSCTGCPRIIDLSNGPDNSPVFSYASRRYEGKIGVDPQFQERPYVWGNLTSMTINVIKPYTGTGALTMTVTANGFNSSLIASNLSQVVDLTTAGKRVITSSSATGSVGADTIAAYGDWISGNVTTVYSAGANGGLDKQPIVELIIETDQGVTKPMSIEYLGPNQSHETLILDTGTVGV